jgi:inorganic triphosphatase YgiF
MPTEVELKLAARPGDLPELKRALVAMTPNAVSSQEWLVSTYYDTPDRALQRGGMTLRVRAQGGRVIQSVKKDDRAASGILSRGEWEDTLSENQPDASAPESGRHLPQGIADDLLPLFVTDVTRTVVEVEPRVGTHIEAAADEGEVRLAGGEASEPISEIELELKSGGAAALYDLALRLLEVASIRVETRTKSERGYRLAEPGSAAVAIHAEPVELDPSMTAEAALQAISQNCLTQLLRNVPAILAAEPEGVHQMRVAVRRIRSVVSSLKEMLPDESRRWLREELGTFAAGLGPARNLDVFATELVPAARAGMPDNPGWEDLFDTLDRLRQAASNRVREEILSERFTVAILRLLRWFEACEWRSDAPAKEANPLASPIGKIAPRVLDQRLRRVRHRSEGFGQLSPPQRHKLRIATKKLRYTIELFSTLFDEELGTKFVSTLKRLQDDLGYANDVRVAHEFVPELFAQAKPRSPAIHAWMDVLQWHNQILVGRESKLRKHLRRLNHATPFWRT